jgi:hypothetical protein
MVLLNNGLEIGKTYRFRVIPVETKVRTITVNALHQEVLDLVEGVPSEIFVYYSWPTIATPAVPTASPTATLKSPTAAPTVSNFSLFSAHSIEYFPEVTPKKKRKNIKKN